MQLIQDGVQPEPNKSDKHPHQNDDMKDVGRAPPPDPAHRQRQILNEVSKRLNATQQYTGTGPLHMYIANYNYMCLDLNVTPAENLQFLQYLFQGYALIYCQAHIEGMYQSFEHAIKFLEEGFPPINKQ